MRQGKFKLAMTLGRSPKEHPERVKICKEMGVTCCVTSPDIYEISHDQYEAAMRQLGDALCFDQLQVCELAGQTSVLGGTKPMKRARAQRLITWLPSGAIQ